MRRLNVIHWAMRELWQTSVRIPVIRPANILDIGCGSGIWAKEVAGALPQSNVAGIDLSLADMNDQPGNLSFFVYASSGLLTAG
jgi:trans-aconitate methyltransferase